MLTRSVLAAALSLALVSPLTSSGQPTIELTEGLGLQRLGRGGRQPFFTDPVALAVARGTWQTPTEGATLGFPGGEEAAWTPIRAEENGWIRSPEMRGGYGYFTVASDRDRAMILHARGHSLVYVNGEPRAGDPYSNGLIRVPVLLREGDNTLLFRGGRGQLRASLVEPPAPISLDDSDHTLPDLIAGETGALWAGIPVLNATIQDASDLEIRASGLDASGTEVTEITTVPNIVRLGVHKAAVRLPRIDADGEGRGSVRLELLRSGKIVHTLDISLRSRQPADKHVRTFLSGIDRSAQYFAVTPMSEADADRDERPALFLTLHGASVEGQGQANAYSPKDWGYVVAPTNRRPFGFDWEDWGRLDALEVLDTASALFGADPDRTYLTGHSMGGHGTWQIGVHFPDRFAAIGPSAGWVSFWSYGGLIDFDTSTEAGEAFTRAASPSDTLALRENFSQLGVYVLHGDADDNVPVDQARTMRAELAAFHPNFAYYEQPGAGHWWGNRCVDWPPMFDFFRANERAERVDTLRFVTASPGVSSACRWASILEQVEPMRKSRIELRIDPAGNAVEGTTENVARLSLRLSETQRQITRGEGADAVTGVAPDPKQPLRVTLDGEEVIVRSWVAADPIVLSRVDGTWIHVLGDDASRKSPHRSGPFKHAFSNDALLVYGTRGNDAENAWALAKARFDAETFKYRGNGAFDVMSDEAFLLQMDQGRGADRNVVLYGNAETNGAWGEVLEGTVVDVRRGEVRIGDRRWTGENQGVLLIRPRRGSDIALVGVVGGSGLEGCRATDRLPYFVSGVAYPDYTVLTPRVYIDGIDGVEAAGFFAGDWGPR